LPYHNWKDYHVLTFHVSIATLDSWNRCTHRGGLNTSSRIAQSNDDEANRVIVRDRTCFALLNTYPYNGGHLLIVPYKQVADLNGLTEEELADLWKLTRRCINALTQVMKPDGFNVGINLGKVAGAGIAEHLHIHVVPRWNGDTNFMPVLANTTVLPAALDEVAANLRAELAK
jgi:ATP adenylyltransferase